MAVFPFLLASSARDLLCPSPTAYVDRMRRFAPRKKRCGAPGSTLDGRYSSGASISSGKPSQNTEIMALSPFLGEPAPGPAVAGHPNAIPIPLFRRSDDSPGVTQLRQGQERH